ncbi:hypothetical protein EXIGLDRAFT_838056 [Exidia glandulosa HHB12029]|uniref:Uncharacterized protein n=1 Tax=Exidia glandulosa HHB12029 TaxID=1314781 RepID=A0A165G803_EXIGL|nr:hypothetical protein EXIGLDRAFT_838056 [Exidia glandulosa HHB12029]
MLVTGPNANCPATESDTAVIIQRVAVQQEKIDAATSALAEANQKLTEADSVFAEAQARFKAVEDAYNVAKYAFWDEERAHSRVRGGVANAQKLLNEAVCDMNVIRAPFHPVRRTPLEVLGLIFEFCVDLDLSQTSTTEFTNCRLQPFRLARVCRLWRRAALMNPRVWTNIDLPLDDIRTRNATAWRRYLSNMFARAGKSSLNLRFARRRDPMSLDLPLIKVFLPELRRCDTLVFSVRDIGKGDAVLSILQAELPLLRDLHLDEAYLATAVDRTSILRHTPMLRTYAGRFQFGGTRLDMPKLLSASLEACSTQTACTIIGAAGSLKTLELDFLPFDDSTSLISPHDHPSQVKFLTITYDGQQSAVMASFARYTRFTAMERLVLQGDRPGFEARMTFFANAAQNMGSSLRRLTVQLASEYSQSLHLLFAGLSHCSSLTYLEFNALFRLTEITKICDYLGSPCDSGSWPCPKLQILDIVGCHFGETCDQGVILSFIERRIAAAKDESVASSLRPKPLCRVFPPSSVSPEVAANILTLLPRPY